MPKVSVVIPCYNTEKYIKKCLDALNQQLFTDFDIILVDDCSDDGTIREIEKYQKTTNLSITLIKNQMNYGPAISRNKGILLSKSEYIAFCDSDDWFEKNFLSEMMKAIKANEADIVFCGYSVIDSSGKKHKRPLKKSSKDLKVKEALLLNVDSLCMLLVKREIMIKSPLPNVRNGEDMAVIPLLIANSSRFSLISECLYNYYRCEASASESANASMINSLNCAYKYTLINLPKKYQQECEYIGIRNLLYSSIITLFKFSYNIKWANEIVNEFESIYPYWKDNSYLKNLAFNKRLILNFIWKRQFGVIKILITLRTLLR